MDAVASFTIDSKLVGLDGGDRGVTEPRGGHVVRADERIRRAPRRLALLAGVIAYARSSGAQAPPASRAFALVELFTSEGCSSCPPADAVLAEIAERARVSGAPVYALSFHVDYWNDLGWPDPFSQGLFTQRQRSYARALGGGTYTPEMVVNGVEGFVGGDRERAWRTIDAALSSPAAAELTLTVRREGEVVTARYSVAGAPAGSEVFVAWVERERVVDVRRGENAGRRLRHVRVVRVLANAPLNGASSGTQTLRVPPDALTDGAEVVTWVQSPSLRVVAAAHASETSR